MNGKQGFPVLGEQPLPLAKAMAVGFWDIYGPIAEFVYSRGFSFSLHPEFAAVCLSNPNAGKVRGCSVMRTHLLRRLGY